MKAKKTTKKEFGKVRFIILLLPLIVAALLLIYTKVSQKMQDGSEFMSPVENATMITSLSVFIGGYLFFLFLMFYEDIKSLFVKHRLAR